MVTARGHLVSGPRLPHWGAAEEPWQGGLSANAGTKPGCCPVVFRILPKADTDPATAKDEGMRWGLPPATHRPCGRELAVGLPWGAPQHGWSGDEQGWTRASLQSRTHEPRGPAHWLVVVPELGTFIYCLKTFSLSFCPFQASGLPKQLLLLASRSGVRGRDRRAHWGRGRWAWPWCPPPPRHSVLVHTPRCEWSPGPGPHLL